MKKVVITGITGMVGSHLADYLLENTDWHIHGLARWNDRMDNIEHLMQRINNKDRVAQMILAPIHKMELEEVENLPDSIRGEGGFGSTGK